MANIITGIRILCSIALLFFPAFSPSFYALYIAAGVSDMIDGTVARKTGTASEFGSKLDTAADFYSGSCMSDKTDPGHSCTDLAYHLDRCDCRDQGGESGFRIRNAKRNCCLTYGSE